MIELVKVEPELAGQAVDELIMRQAELGLMEESFGSMDEALGAITEEYSTLVEKIRGKNYNDIEHAALDLAAQALWLYVSMQANSRV